MKRLIVTADDFGLAVPVNEAVEEAHRRGILTAASLMVGAPAAADAVARARRLPGLGVGLHLVLVHGLPVLSPEAVSGLTGPDGTLSRRPLRTGAALALRRSARRQMEAEVRAQFEAFRGTGLQLDHVNGHHHFHLHPAVLALVLRVAAEYRVPAVRVVHEPALRSWRASGSGLGQRVGNWLFHLPWARLMKGRLRAAGVAYNDALFGLNDSGRMDRGRLLGFLERLPDGVSELYCHPATRRWAGRFAPRRDYACVEEFEALTDPEVAATIRRRGIATISFARLGAHHRVNAA